VAGLTVAAIAVPQAMAYALIAGVDPVYGLYSAVVVTAIASVFGSSSHLINGPTNAISLVVFSALALIEVKLPAEAAEAVFLLAAMVGLIQIAIAVLKLGDLTRYISESVILGFMTGAGFLIILTQANNLLGLPEQGTGHQHILVRLWLTITSGQSVSLRSVIVCLTTMLLIRGLRKMTRKYQLPRLDMLFALVVVSAMVAAFGWSHPVADDKTIADAAPLHGVVKLSAVAVVGQMPVGLPVPAVPKVHWIWVQKMGTSALAIACLGLLEALAISKTIAQQTREPLDYNRQCLAEGLANLGGSFFQCLPGSGSLTRSAINFQAGAVTRWSGVFAAAAVALVIVLFGSWTQFIPKPALAGILLVTAGGLVDWQRVSYAMRASPYDAILVLTTALVAIFWSVELSVLIGVALSIVMFVPRAARINVNELILGADGYLHDRQSDNPCCKHMAILDLEGELFFGAAPELDRYFTELKQRVSAGIRIIILRVKRTRNPDMVCMERFQIFIKDMEQKGVVVLLCGVRKDFNSALADLRFYDWLPPERVFRENAGHPGTATLAAVHYAYGLLGDDVCDHCPHRKK